MMSCTRPRRRALGASAAVILARLLALASAGPCSDEQQTMNECFSDVNLLLRLECERCVAESIPDTISKCGPLTKTICPALAKCGTCRPCRQATRKYVECAIGDVTGCDLLCREDFERVKEATAPPCYEQETALNNCIQAASPTAAAAGYESFFKSYYPEAGYSAGCKGWETGICFAEEQAPFSGWCYGEVQALYNCILPKTTQGACEIDCINFISPTSSPSRRPTSAPTPQPTARPTRAPTSRPTRTPTPRPTLGPTLKPFTRWPTRAPFEHFFTPRPTLHPGTPKPVPATSQPTALKPAGVSSFVGGFTRQPVVTTSRPVASTPVSVEPVAAVPSPAATTVTSPQPVTATRPPVPNTVSAAPVNSTTIEPNVTIAQATTSPVIGSTPVPTTTAPTGRPSASPIVEPSESPSSGPSAAPSEPPTVVAPIVTAAPTDKLVCVQEDLALKVCINNIASSDAQSNCAQCVEGARPGLDALDNMHTSMLNCAGIQSALCTNAPTYCTACPCVAELSTMLACRVAAATECDIGTCLAASTTSRAVIQRSIASATLVMLVMTVIIQ